MTPQRSAAVSCALLGVMSRELGVIVLLIRVLTRSVRR